MWNIEKIVSKGDYLYCIVRNHPNRTKNDYVLHHRVVMENHLGRLLSTEEIVHHLNGDKKDNSIENLQVLTVLEHNRIHALESPRKRTMLKCPWCGIIFERFHNRTHLVRKSLYTACSRSCSAKFSRKIQLFGKTVEVETAISGNVVIPIIGNDNREVTYDNEEP